MGTLAPSAWKDLGSRRNSTISCSSAFASSTPAMSLNVTARLEDGLMRCGLTRGITFSVRHMSPIRQTKNRIAITGSHASAKFWTSCAKEVFEPAGWTATAGVCAGVWWWAAACASAGWFTAARAPEGVLRWTVPLCGAVAVCAPSPWPDRAGPAAWTLTPPSLQPSPPSLASLTQLHPLWAKTRRLSTGAPPAAVKALRRSRGSARRDRGTCSPRTRGRARRSARRRRGRAAPHPPATDGGGGRSRRRRSPGTPCGSGASR